MLRITRYHIDSALAVILILVLGLHYTKFSGSFDAVLIIVAAVFGTVPVFWSAIQAVREREWASMDMLASIALAFSLIALQWASAVFIALMLAAARILDDLTQERMERSIKGLLKLRPNTAKVERNGKLETVLLAGVRAGEVVVVDLGERIPIDGLVLSGEAAVDESSLTGESLPVEKAPGAKAYSSTLISSGSLRIKTERVGKDTTLERIIALVESARAEKPKAQTLGERFGKVYLIAVFIISALLLAATRNVPLVLSVVLVVCADDIAVAIPIAYLRAIGAAARRGVIVKGALHLETLGKARVIVFDKTGTLTKGKLAVSRVVPAAGQTERRTLEVGALAAQRSKHPLSRAVVAYAAAQGTAEQEPDSVEEVSGKGIVAHVKNSTAMIGREAFLKDKHIVIPEELKDKAVELSNTGQSVAYVAHNNVAVGFFAVSDEVKHNAKHAIAELKRLGVAEVVMLTGDNEQVARTVAHAIGIDDFRAGLLPEGKVDVIKELHKKGIVVMVGDGVNDAAALSAAHVGIAMGAMGVEGAIESAEIVLMRDDLMAISETMRLARSVARVSAEDFGIWGVTNIAGLALVFGGVIGPPGAAAYNFISDFFPLLNSLRVRIK